MLARIHTTCRLSAVWVLALAPALAQGELLGYWAFDDSANVGIDTAHGWPLQAAGDAHHVAPGHSGGGLSLDGNGDYLHGSPVVPTGDSPYTISAWIRPDVTGHRGFVGWGNYGQGRRVNAFRLFGDNSFRHYWWGADIDRDAAVAGVDLDDGAWHHVVATYNGSTRALYVDGKPIGSDLPGANNATAANFRIGSTNFGEFFHGTVDDVALWNQGLAPNQIRALAAGTAPVSLPAADTLVGHWVADDYAGGNWLDRVNAIPAAVEDNPSPQANQLNGHAVVNFDGNDAFRVAAADSPMANVGDFTLAVVFRTTTPGVGNPTDGWWTNSGIVDMEMPGWVQDWGLVINNQSSIGAGLGGAWPNQITLPSAQTGLNDGQAHAAVYTRQGGTVTLTVDGVTVAQTNNGAGMTLERLANLFTIGRRQTGGNFYAGDLAEVQIRDGKLTIGQAQNLTMQLARTYGFASTTNWINPGAGPWGTGGNWSAGVPGPLTDATVDNGGTAQLAVGTAAAGSLTLGGGAGGRLDWTGGALDCWDIMVGANGTLDRSGYATDWAYGGRLTVSGNGQALMPAAGSEIQLNDGATMSLSGNASVSNFHAVIVGDAGSPNTMQTVAVADNAQMTGLNYLVVGKSSHRGQVIQSGGAVAATNIWVGEYGTSEGLYALSGGSLSANLLYVGKDGGTTGAVNVGGGTLSVSGNPQIGRYGFGTLDHSGGTFTWNGWLVMGRYGGGHGIYTLHGSAVARGNNLIVAEDPASTGVLDLADAATLVVNNSLEVGRHSTGTLRQGGGRLHVGQHFLVASDSDGTGLVEQTGGLVTVNLNPQVGSRGKGTFDHSGGIFYHVRHMAIGRYNTGDGTYSVSGSAINAGRWIIVAEDAGAAGVMPVSGGTVVLGGSSVSPASLEVARHGTGTVTQTGGAVYADTVMIASGSGNGLYDLQGGELESRQITYGPGAAAFRFTGGTLRPGTVGFSLHNQGGTLDVATPATAGLRARWYDGNQMTDDPTNWSPPPPALHYDEVVDAVEWGGGAPPPGYPSEYGGNTSDYFGIVYTGYLYAPAAGSYSFRERVDDSSILYIDGTPILWDYTAGSDMGEPPGNPWTVHAATTVPLSAGWHAVEFRVSDHWGGQNAYLEWDPAGGSDWSLLVGGAIFADLGSPVGKTTLNGDYTQDQQGTLAIDLDGYLQGQSYDLLWVEGSAILDGILEVSVLSDFGLTCGNWFDVLEATRITDNGLLIGESIDEGTFLRDIVDLGNGRYALRLTFVPEPTTLALVGLGLPALLRRLRRRNRRPDASS